MAAEKYIKSNGGKLTNTSAVDASTGVTEAGKIVALDSTGKLAQTLFPTGMGADTSVFPASETLGAGDFVNVWNDSGTAKVRKADASADKPADGFVLAAVTSGANADVYREGEDNQMSGLTAGTDYYLSATTAGGVSTTVPTATGSIQQWIGKATSATSLNFKYVQPILN